QLRNLQNGFNSLISTKHSSRFSALISENSKLLNPGVSATNPSAISHNAICLVVCFPLPKLVDISAVFKFSDGSNRFKKDDFPTPDCPTNTVTWLESIASN